MSEKVPSPQGTTATPVAKPASYKVDGNYVPPTTSEKPPSPPPMPKK